MNLVEHFEHLIINDGICGADVIFCHNVCPIIKKYEKCDKYIAKKYAITVIDMHKKINLL